VLGVKIWWCGLGEELELPRVCFGYSLRIAFSVIYYNSLTMSLVQLQGIARRLAAAGYIEHPTGQGVYILHIDYVDDTNCSLICKHWTGYSFESQEFIHKPVRRDTPAAYFITPAYRCIVCISSSSTLCILEYNTEEEEWVTRSISRCNVHHNGKFAACMTEGRQLHVFFQNPSGKLIHLDMTSRVLSTVPVHATVGSPMFTGVFGGKVHVFYISSRDHRIHFVVMVPGKAPKDNTMSKCELTEGLRQFTVTLTLSKGEASFSAYVLTEGFELLRISGDKKGSVLGTMDAAGEFVSALQMDRCCTEAWDGTLLADRLKGYLNSDPYFINSPGGEHEVTPLAAACWKGHLDIVRLLIDHGADPKALSPKNRTPLFYATTRSPPENRSTIVRTLLRAGADVDQCYAENNFNTPLMDAIKLFRDKDVVHELLKHGASLTVQNGEGQTAGMLAKGAGLDKELPELRQQPLVNFPPQLPLQQPPPPQSLPPQSPLSQSPPLSQSHQDFSNMQKRRLIEFLVSMLMLIVAYTNTEDILDEVLRGQRGVGSITEG
jgi:ankyrin repeat protein